MNNISVSKRTDYKGCPIVLRHIKPFIFEYLLVYKNDIYGDYVIYKGAWWQRFLPERWRFTKKEIENTFKILMSGACDTIDALQGKG